MITAILSIGPVLAHPFDKDIIGHQIELTLDEDVLVEFVLEVPNRQLREMLPVGPMDPKTFLRNMDWGSQLRLTQDENETIWDLETLEITQRPQFVELRYIKQGPLFGEKLVLTDAALLGLDSVYQHQILVSDAQQIVATDSLYERSGIWRPRFAQWSTSEDGRLIRLVLSKNHLAPIRQLWRRFIWGDPVNIPIAQARSEQSLRWYWSRGRTGPLMAAVLSIVVAALFRSRSKQSLPELWAGLGIGWSISLLDWQSAVLTIALMPLIVQAFRRSSTLFAVSMLAGLCRPYWIGAAMLCLGLLLPIGKRRPLRGWVFCASWTAFVILVGIWYKILLN